MKFGLRFIGYIFTGMLLGGVIGFGIVVTHIDDVEAYLGILSNRTKSSALGLEIGSFAPDFSLFTHDGNVIKLSEAKGTPTIINFWATWCAPCIVEMPMLQNTHDAFNSRLKVFAVNAGESQSSVRTFVDEYDISFPTLLDPSEHVQKMYLIRAYPTTYFIDNKGVIRAIHVGILSEKQLESYLREIGAFNG